MGLALLAVPVLSVAPAQAGDDPAGLVGSPTSVAIVPSDATLLGRRATRQLIVSATSADGTVHDLTRALEWISRDPEVATVSPGGQVVPRGNGTATIVARRGSVEVQANVKVERMEQPAPVSFRRDVIPAFSQAGCNMGACHGTPTGKGGFKLSFEPPPAGAPQSWYLRRRLMAALVIVLVALGVWSGMATFGWLGLRRQVPLRRIRSAPIGN